MQVVPSDKKYVLYIEDDTENIELLDHVLYHTEFNIKIVKMQDGAKALDFLEQAKLTNRLPDMILLDINMSKLNGKETFVCIQADKMFARIPIAVITTSSFELDVNYFKKYQIPYIIKPGDVNKFKEEVNGLLKQVFQEN